MKQFPECQLIPTIIWCVRVRVTAQALLNLLTLVPVLFPPPFKKKKDFVLQQPNMCGLFVGLLRVRRSLAPKTRTMIEQRAGFMHSKPPKDRVGPVVSFFFFQKTLTVHQIILKCWFRNVLINQDDATRPTANLAGADCVYSGDSRALRLDPFPLGPL